MEVVKEAMWLKEIIGEFEIFHKVVIVNYDSQSALYLGKHQVFHEISKNIEARLYFIRDNEGHCKCD